MEQIALPQTRWSAAVEEADWIAGSLAPFDSGLVASIIPPGFEAYARLLHPVRALFGRGSRAVRWAEVAAWSGMPLRPDSQFHSIALPPAAPAGPPPWQSQGPERGTLDIADAQELIGLLGPRTATPGDCLFCMWDGWGWDAATIVALPDDPQLPVPDLVPPEVRYGPHVELPGRDYLLYTGPIDAALAFAGSHGQTPNLWWPADRAWCVASEIDLCWTYVGGSRALIGTLLADPRLEALPAAAGQPHSRVEDFITHLSERCAAELAATGKSSIETSRGTIRATLRGPGRLARSGSLRIQSERRNGESSRTDHRLTATGPALADEITAYLTMAIIELAED
ncbi:MAG TPA: hypothetical protein VGI31_05190 [Streptosporangiaceae bacterium]